jgi:hypothetical protein
MGEAMKEEMKTLFPSIWKLQLPVINIILQTFGLFMPCAVSRFSGPKNNLERIYFYLITKGKYHFHECDLLNSIVS